MPGVVSAGRGRARQDGRSGASGGYGGLRVIDDEQTAEAVAAVEEAAMAWPEMMKPKVSRPVSAQVNTQQRRWGVGRLLPLAACVCRCWRA
eukprot:COSAG01_NODE_6093_length_3854_cov_7.192011_1_plen_90_part_10